jgi:hypothetical protein
MSDTQTRLDALEIAYAAAIASRDRHRERAANLAAELERVTEALRAAEGVLFALPKSARSKRRREVLAQARAALAGGARAAKENQ